MASSFLSLPADAFTRQVTAPADCFTRQITPTSEPFARQVTVPSPVVRPVTLVQKHARERSWSAETREPSETFRLTPMQIPQSPKVGPASGVRSMPASPHSVGSFSRWVTPLSPKVQPVQQVSSGPSFELVRNTNARLDDYRLPRLMEEIAALSLAQFHVDITEEPELDWLCAEMYDPMEERASFYDQCGGRLDVLVERFSNALAGFIWYGDAAEDQTLYIKYIAMVDRFKQFGLGRFLVSCAVDAARKVGARIEKVSLRSVKEAIPFYEAIGFHIVCEEGKDGEMRMIMNILSEEEKVAAAAPAPEVVSAVPFIFDDPSLVYSAFDYPTQHAKVRPVMVMPSIAESKQPYDPTASWGDWPFACQTLRDAVVVADSNGTPVSTPKHLPLNSFPMPPPLSLSMSPRGTTVAAAPFSRQVTPSSSQNCPTMVVQALTPSSQMQGHVVVDSEPCPFSSVLREVLIAQSSPSPAATSLHGYVTEPNAFHMPTA